MAFQMTMGMTYDGREPEVLSDLILRRQKLFGETAQQAVIGTGISVMTSLRAQTNIADETKTFAFSKSSEEARWVTRDKKHRIEILSKPNDRSFTNLAWPYHKGVLISVYDCTIIKQGKEEKILVVAYNASDVAKYLKRRIKRYKGMAKSAWGHLMRMTSQYAADDPISGKAAGVLRKSLSVVSGGNQYDFAMQITDDLQYAGSALKGGPASITHAMQAASNKIAGRIRKFCADHPTFAGENIQTPFPEIAKRK